MSPTQAVDMNRTLCDPSHFGKHITARVICDRRYVYRGVIAGPSESGFAIDGVPTAIYELRVTNKPEFAVGVFQQDGEWLVYKCWDWQDW